MLRTVVVFGCSYNIFIVTVLYIFIFFLSWFTLLSFPKSNYYRKKTTRQAKLLKPLAGVHVGAVDLVILLNCPRGRVGAHVGAVSNFISFVEGGVAVLLRLILLFLVFIVLVVHRILLGRVGKALLVLVGAIIGPITMLLAATDRRCCACGRGACSLDQGCSRRP